MKLDVMLLIHMYIITRNVNGKVKDKRPLDVPSSLSGSGKDKQTSSKARCMLTFDR